MNEGMKKELDLLVISMCFVNSYTTRYHSSSSRSYASDWVNSEWVHNFDSFTMKTAGISNKTINQPYKCVSIKVLGYSLAPFIHLISR